MSDITTEETKAELYERATELDIPGRSTMSKDELAAAVAEYEGEGETWQASETGQASPPEEVFGEIGREGDVLSPLDELVKEDRIMHRTKLAPPAQAVPAQQVMLDEPPREELTA